MSKVVYLLGAGASRGTRDKGKQILTGLPIVNEIEGELVKLIDLLSSFPLKDKELKESLSSLINDFRKLKHACLDYATIDSYAKKLWLQGNKKEFAQVELLLTIFFILEQIIHKPDIRYKTFLSKVVQKDVVEDVLNLRKDISILSWNYDNQIELAYRSYFDVGYSFIREVFGIYDVKGDDLNPYLKKHWRIIKLNGTANFTREEDWLPSSDTNTIDNKLLKKILGKYALCKGRGLCDGMVRLNFAWEDKWSKDMLTNKIPSLVHDAQTLVVIGYSFPDYNRDIDKNIFKDMPHLENIYIQDKYPNRIQKNIKPVIPEDRRNKIRIVLHGDVEQFYLPPEL